MSTAHENLLREMIAHGKRSWCASDAPDSNSFILEYVIPLRDLRKRGCIAELRELNFRGEITQIEVIGPVRYLGWT